ncbi:MAG TPA: glycoside hydrolase family protein [Streptosporangiaceae bacterium]
MLWRSRLTVLVTIAASTAAAVGGAEVLYHYRTVRPVSMSASQGTELPASQPPAVPSSSPRTSQRHPGQAMTQHAAPNPPATTAGARSSKKGVATWSFTKVGKALTKSGATWYYTWAPDHHGIGSPRGVHFVPMIWGPGSVTAANLSEVKHEGHFLLGFNEPDMSSQSNMSVPQALRLWPRLMSTGMTLGSPAVASGGATPGGWLDRFMSGVKSRHYRVNFIPLHWYGGDFVTHDAVSQLQSYLQAVHARYHKPIWLTEFALIRFGSSTTFPSARQQAAFVTAATKMLQRLPWVQRYAWFALPADKGDGTAGLFHPGAVATRAGRAFEAAH